MAATERDGQGFGRVADAEMVDLSRIAGAGLDHAPGASVAVAQLGAGVRRQHQQSAGRDAEAVDAGTDRQVEAGIITDASSSSPTRAIGARWSGKMPGIAGRLPV